MLFFPSNDFISLFFLGMPLFSLFFLRSSLGYMERKRESFLWVGRSVQRDELVFGGFSFYYIPHVDNYRPIDERIYDFFFCLLLFLFLFISR